jgi:hypothetical protein
MILAGPKTTAENRDRAQVKEADDVHHFTFVGRNWPSVYTILEHMCCAIVNGRWVCNINGKGNMAPMFCLETLEKSACM